MSARKGYEKFGIFCLLWAVLFVLYLPAVRAGRVGDFPGWVTNLRTMSFWDYVNRRESHIPSLYQFTQIVTYFFFKLFGVKSWLWHLLYISMQACNGLLLFVLFKNLLSDSNVARGKTIALAGALLFCIMPNITEVVVWESAYHYLQGMLLVLLVLVCLQRFWQTKQVKYAWFGGILFFLSTYSLEIFYLTPFLCFTLSWYYYKAISHEKKMFTRSLLFFSAPQVIFFAFHLILLNSLYHSGIGHIGSDSITFTLNNFSKPLKFIFHLLFFGRYFSVPFRHQVYAFCESLPALLSFYFIAIVVFSLVMLRFKKMSNKGKLTALAFVWVALCTALVCPVWFPDDFLVMYDRYTYMLGAFTYMLVALTLSYITFHVFAAVIWGAFALVGAFFTVKLNLMWRESTNLVNTLMSTFPNDPSKTVLILNLPQNYRGIPMLDSREEGQFKITYNALMPDKINNPVFEVASNNIDEPADGVHIMVLNDTLLHVTLNDYGRWWWWSGLGAISHESEYYKLNLIDPGHWYELQLKKPSSQFLLLYVVDDQWKKVDMKINSIDQY